MLITTGARQYYGTDDVGSDTRTWLSVILANQATSMEVFEGSNTNSSLAKKSITKNLNQVTALVTHLLNKIIVNDKGSSTN